MRSRLMPALVAVMLVAAGCARTASMTDAGDSPAGTTASASGATTRIAAQAVVTGYVRIYGGPMNPSTGQETMTGAPTPGSQVTIVDAAGHKKTTTSDTAGRFTFRLPPGTYRLDCSGEAEQLALLPGTILEHDCQLAVP